MTNEYVTLYEFEKDIAKMDIKIKIKINDSIRNSMLIKKYPFKEDIKDAISKKETADKIFEWIENNSKFSTCTYYYYEGVTEL